MWQYNPTPEIYHGLFSKWKEKQNHKYIDKYKSKKGNWVYVYKEKVKNAVKSLPDTIVKKANQAVNTIEKSYGNITRNNIYDADNWSYDRKVKEVAKTKEWKDIVKRRDPEYVKKDANGNTKFDIDSYLFNKKHPVFDALDDIVSGRPITINEITMPAMIAGLDDYVNAGLAYIALRVNIVKVGMKFRQGSYSGQIEDATSQIELGKQMVDEILSTYNTNAVSTSSKAVSDLAAVTSTIENILSTHSDVSTDDLMDILENNATVKSIMEENSLGTADLRNAIEKART